MIKNKKILLFGGSGSLGNEFIYKYINNNEIINYSRDECKHWQMSIKYKTDKLRFIIGDIRNYNTVENAILRENPNIIIIMAALKHVDRCEFAINECMSTNCYGPMNILNAIEKNNDRLKNLETVVMISTDKACEPTNVYGMSKAVAESAVVEKSFFIKNIKFVNVRYGNVLNSRGSIIPLLHEIGKNNEIKDFTLTNKNMTRFVMTLEQSVDLIDYAINNGESGDTIIPELTSMKLIDLFEIFSDKYNKPIKIIGLRSGEKMKETLISETQSLRLKKIKSFTHIKPCYNSKYFNENELCSYDSTINPLTKEQLEKYLIDLKLI